MAPLRSRWPLPRPGQGSGRSATTTVMRLAAVQAWVLGLGFGLPAAFGTWHYATRGSVWTFVGFPTNTAGPLFVRMGIDTSVLLLATFVAVCFAEIVMGVLLWTRRRSGAVLSLTLLPVELAFWIGLVLPFALLGGLLRVALTVISWPSREDPSNNEPR